MKPDEHVTQPITPGAAFTVAIACANKRVRELEKLNAELLLQVAGMQAVSAQFSPDENTMIQLLYYPNAEGLHPNEVRWRNLARKLNHELNGERKRAEGLQSMNSTLAAEVDLMRLVVEAAQSWYIGKIGSAPLGDRVAAYESAKEQANG